LSGRSPFVPVKGPEQNALYGLGFGGALLKEKSSFYLSVYGINSYETPNLNVALPSGPQSFALGLKTPRDNLFVNGQVDYALTLDQTLRFAYNLTRLTTDNLGVGGYDGPGRAYGTDSDVNNLRIQHFGPSAGARSRGRGSSSLVRRQYQSATEAPTIRVLDAFTSGGARLSAVIMPGRFSWDLTWTTSWANIRCAPASCSMAAGIVRTARRTISARTFNNLRRTS
jgi:hypothetical protein